MAMNAAREWKPFVCVVAVLLVLPMGLWSIDMWTDGPERRLLQSVEEAADEVARGKDLGRVAKSRSVWIRSLDRNGSTTGWVNRDRHNRLVVQYSEWLMGEELGGDYTIIRVDQAWGNTAEREEVRTALKTGSGSICRHQDALTICFAVRQIDPHSFAYAARSARLRLFR
ncbi:MAG: hypothetical protein AAFS10_09125 [Myxococcota bacterium]